MDKGVDVNDTKSVAEYLIGRALSAPKLDADKAIVENDDILARIAGLDEEALAALIEARLQPIREELIAKATPPEVLVLRQALVEVSALLIDHEKYKQEYKRRAKDIEERKREVTPDTIAAPAPMDNGTT